MIYKSVALCVFSRVDSSASRQGSEEGTWEVGRGSAEGREAGEEQLAQAIRHNTLGCPYRREKTPRGFRGPVSQLEWPLLLLPGYPTVSRSVCGLWLLVE